MWQFWEEVFGCRFEPAGLGVPACSGQEALAAQAQLYLDVSDLRAEYNIYKAVYTLAHALHSLLQCVPGQGPFPERSCASLDNMAPWQVRKTYSYKCTEARPPGKVLGGRSGI